MPYWETTNEMSDSEQLAKLDEGVEAWNQWREDPRRPMDLSGADLSGRDLSNADLRLVDLSRANLRGADLRGAGFSGSNLFGASLREANLQGVDLSVAQRGLQTEQLAGADLTGATLSPELTKLYDSLENVNNISESARKLFLAVLAACLYSWLTIATTTDVNLITNRASSPLPIIQTSIPIAGFYAVAPLLWLCVYFYFHFYLQKLWEEFSSLPAILPDGRPLHAKIDPWLLNDLVRSHLPKLNVNRPFMSYFQLWISVLQAWWAVPITMFLFWGRYLPRHDRTGMTFHVVLLMISLTAAARLYRLAVATLRGAERKRFSWREMLTSRVGFQTAAFAVAVGALFGVVSWGAIMGVPSNAPILGAPLLLQRSNLGNATGHLTWVPRLMALGGGSPFAYLAGAEVSQKRPGWSRNDKDLDSVTGARLEGANLRYALASGAFLAGADLGGADMSGAVLHNANLQGADLSDADLNGADLSDAVLRSAKLRRANLTGANLNIADNATDLRGADLLTANLRDARMRNADLRGAILRSAVLDAADLSYADLSYADLFDAQLGCTDPSAGAEQRCADLTGANLQGARLRGAKFWGTVVSTADLSYADLHDTDLQGARFNGSNVTYSDFRGARNLDPKTAMSALNWDKAFYDDETLKALGLPPDHNDKLSAQRMKEGLQQKQNAGQTAPKPTPPKQ